ncbi:MAG: DUF92 domain-containing protein [Thaumarchaeota archaeon]|nr:DUF92 domain-containing protein [Nitrososphaerota archaeon]
MAQALQGFYGVGQGEEKYMISLIAIVIEFFIVIAVALAAVLLNTIDGRGFLASVLVGLAIIYGGGLQWFIVVAVFFILGVVFTLYRYGYKKTLGGAQEKGGARNWPNILANGGMTSFFAVVNFLYPGPVLGALFLGAVSASAADTAATEIGLLSRSRPRLITNLTKVVAPGTSGGVSYLGFVGAGFSSVAIGAIALLLGVPPGGLLVVPLCLFAGLAGAVFDSLLGATVQRAGFCKICLKPTEALRHCGEPTKVTTGAGFIENNLVNLLATGAGAAASLGALLLTSAAG